MARVEYLITSGSVVVAACIGGLINQHPVTVPKRDFPLWRGKFDNAVVTAAGVLKGKPGLGGLPAKDSATIKQEHAMAKQARKERRTQRVGAAPEIPAIVQKVRNPADVSEFTGKVIGGGLEMTEVLGDVVQALARSKYRETYLLKGSFVMDSLLITAGCGDLQRETTDIDLNFVSLPVWEKFVRDLPEMLTRLSTMGYVYTEYMRVGVDARNKSDRIVMKAMQGGDGLLFGVDMSVKPLHSGVAYELAGMSFIGASMYTMLVDKLCVLSERRLLRRPKDLYDVYAITSAVNVPLTRLHQEFEKIKRPVTRPPFILDVAVVGDLRTAYDRYAQGVTDAAFEVVYPQVVSFAVPVYEAVLTGRAISLTWNGGRRKWV